MFSACWGAYPKLLPCQVESRARPRYLNLRADTTHHASFHDNFKFWILHVAAALLKGESSLKEGVDQSGDVLLK